MQLGRAQLMNELVEYVRELRGSDKSILMSDLTQSYDKHAAALGFPDIKSNTTRLRETLISMIPGLDAVEINRKWSLVYDEDIAHAVEQAQETPMSEIGILYKAASILRKYIPIHAIYRSFGP